MICEGCIKQDTCKHYEWVKDFRLKNGELSEPLEMIATCKYKQTYPPYPPNCTDTDCDTTTYNPAVADWDTTHS